MSYHRSYNEETVASSSLNVVTALGGGALHASVCVKQNEYVSLTLNPKPIALTVTLKTLFVHRGLSNGLDSRGATAYLLIPKTTPGHGHADSF